MKRIKNKKVKSKKYLIIFGGTILIVLTIAVLYGRNMLLMNNSVSDYSCPLGWKLDGDNCYRSATYNTSYECPEGWNRNGKTCSKAATKNEDFSCPSGWYKNVLSGNCKKASTTTTEYSCNDGWSREGAQCYRAATNSLKETCPSSDWQKNLTSSSCRKLATTIINYKCSSGWTLDGSSCYRQATNNPKTVCPSSDWNKNVINCYKKATTISERGCPSGWIFDGSRCYRAATSTSKCPSKFSPNRSRCTRTYYAHKIPGTTNQYVCDQGGKLSGKKCTITKDYNVDYSCSIGNREGTRCYMASSYYKKYHCDQGNLRDGYCYTSLAFRNNYTCSVGTLKVSRCYISATSQSKLYCKIGSLRKNGYCYTPITYKDNYKCSVGNLKGTRCYVSANSKTNQSCSKGTLKNGNCIYVPKKTISYKCDEGTLKNGYCYKQAQEENNYTCSVGNLDGSKCYISASRNFEQLSYNKSYSSGDAQVNGEINSSEPDPSAVVNFWSAKGLINSSDFVYPKDEATGKSLGAWPKNYASIPTQLSNMKMYHDNYIWPINTNGNYKTAYEHLGMDIQAEFGTPVYSPVDGVMIYSEWGHTMNKDTDESSYSISIRVSNPIKYNGVLLDTIYLTHMSGIRYRCDDGKCNRKVKKGELLGFSGTAAGNRSSNGSADYGMYGPHLHITYYQNNPNDSNDGYDSGLYTSAMEQFYSIKTGVSRQAGK